MTKLMIDADSGQPLPPEMQDMMAAFREQLLIVFVKRLGGKVTIPVSETDNTDQDMLYMQSDPTTGTFTFEVKRKS